MSIAEIKTGEPDHSPLPHGLLAAAASGASSPGLPDGVWRDDCLETAIEANRGCLTPSAERVLRFYARQTRPADWSEPGRGPVAYSAQRNAVEKLNLDRRSIYRAECQLEDLGLIVKLAADNGRRYGPKGDDGEACGIYFAPMIARYEHFAGQSAAATAARDRLSAARKLASGLRYRLRGLAKAAGGATEQAKTALKALDQMPSAIMGMNDIHELAEIAVTFAALIRAFEATQPALSEQHDSVENQEKREKMSHTWDSGVPRQIYTTTNSSLVRSTRNAEKNMRTAANAAEDNSSKASANADEWLRKNDAEAGGAVKTGNVSSGRNRAETDDDRAGSEIPTAELIAMLRDKARYGPSGEIPLPFHLEDSTAEVPETPENSDFTTTDSTAKVAWTVNQLFAAASVEFRAMLDASRYGTGQINQHSLINAAETICHFLGINQSAWADACELMGRYQAALAVLVIDRNRTHPTCPVHNPGGVLRAMTERAKAGELRLDASIFAIIRRADDASLN